MSEERRGSERSRLASLLYYGGRVVRQGSGFQIEPRSLVYYGSMLVLVGLGCWLYLHQATQASLTGAEIVRLIRARQRLSLEIAELETQVALAGGSKQLLASVDETELVRSWDLARERRISYVPVQSSVGESDDEPVPTRPSPGRSATKGLVAIWHELRWQMEEWLGQPVSQHGS